MSFFSNPNWFLPEYRVTPENTYFNRRKLLKSFGLGLSYASFPFASLYADDKNKIKNSTRFDLLDNQGLTEEKIVKRYNNFYEFGATKQIWKAAQKLKTNPWKFEIIGEVDNPISLDIRELLSLMELEERIYKLRCVEAWSMVVPWIGFPLKNLLKLCGLKPSAKFVSFISFYNPDIAKGQKQTWYPWPYQEAITIFEAMNELTFMASGLYGKQLPKQNGAPLRLLLPWKYGFKSSKSIVKIEVTKERPQTFWETIEPTEYGFWANVNPDIPHPRWSQNKERDIGSGKMIPTKIFNGYGRWVSEMYKNIENSRLFT